jgi:hypothetical protein
LGDTAGRRSANALQEALSLDHESSQPRTLEQEKIRLSGPAKLRLLADGGGPKVIPLRCYGPWTADFQAESIVYRLSSIAATGVIFNVLL